MVNGCTSAANENKVFNKNDAISGKTTVLLKNDVSRDKKYIWMKIGLVWKTEGSKTDAKNIKEAEYKINKHLEFILKGEAWSAIARYNSKDFLINRKNIENEIKISVTEKASKSIPLKIAGIQIERVDILEFASLDNPHKGEEFPTPSKD